jgi:hypothetical protein
VDLGQLQLVNQRPEADVRSGSRGGHGSGLGILMKHSAKDPPYRVTWTGQDRTGQDRTHQWTRQLCTQARPHGEARKTTLEVCRVGNISVRCTENEGETDQSLELPPWGYAASPSSRYGERAARRPWAQPEVQVQVQREATSASRKPAPVYITWGENSDCGGIQGLTPLFGRRMPPVSARCGRGVRCEDIAASYPGA